MNDEREDLDALYEIAEMLNVPASGDPPRIAVVRAVREHIERLRAVTNNLRWTGPAARKGAESAAGPSVHGYVRMVQTLADSSLPTVTILRDALARYGEHDGDCAASVVGAAGNAKCTCGLDDILARLAMPTVPLSTWEQPDTVCRECGHARRYHGVARDDQSRYCSHLVSGDEQGQRIAHGVQGTPCRCSGFHPLVAALTKGEARG